MTLVPMIAVVGRPFRGDYEYLLIVEGRWLV